MNRQILFRAKSVGTKDWHEGFYFFHKGRNQHIILTLIDGVDKLVEVIPETVGQFTGLTDENGVKIFDEDVVYCDGCGKCTVYFNKQMASFRLMLVDTYEDTTKISHGFEETEPLSEIVVIGNVHDNPNLLNK